MNPNLNNHMGIPHNHQGSHPSSQLQPAASSVHSLHPQPHVAHPHPHPRPPQTHFSPHYHPQQPQAPERLAIGDSIDHHQVQQQNNIEHYKSSATPAYHGYIETTHDALIIFNACHLGTCTKVTRRLHERERRSIDSGAVYVFDEAEAGIKRWTDGRLWSPSRILNNFLVYREIDQKRQIPPTSTPSVSSHNAHNDASSSMIANNLVLDDHPSASSSVPQHPSAPSRPATPSHQQNSTNAQHSQSSPKIEGSHIHNTSPQDSKPIIHLDGKDQLQSQSSATNSENQCQVVSVRRPMNRERERALVGSLTSTYKFRPDGLVKKTISLAGMHMISYYRMEDVLLGRLTTPKTNNALRIIPIDERFLQSNFFRCPPAWGYANGSFWVHDEGPEEPSPVSNSINTSPFQNGHRSGPPPLPSNQLTTSNSGARGSLLQPHPNVPDRLLPSALSRPSSSSSSAGSPSATSPVSPSTFPLLTAPNLSVQSGASRSPVINLARSRQQISGHAAYSSNSSSSNSGLIGRPGANSSTRYEPYPRPPRSPPLPVSSHVTHSNLTDQQSAVSYYAQNQSTSGANGYPTNPFISDSPPTSLVAPDRNNRPDQTAHNAAHNGRNLEPIGEVTYGASGSYRTHTTTSGGGESMYGHYHSTDATNNPSRSASVPPSPYGLPSMNRLRVAGPPGSTSSSNTDARGIGDYQFSVSPTQQQAGRLSSPSLNHRSYGAYISPVPSEFRCHAGGSNLPGRENNHYNSSQQSLGSLRNPAGQTTSVSGTQSPTFLYPSPSASTAASSFSSYQFSNNVATQQPQNGNINRRGSGMGTVGSEIDRDNAEQNSSGTRISGLNRIPSRVPQRNENDNSASHWGQVSASHTITMKTEEGGSV